MLKWIASPELASHEQYSAALDKYKACCKGQSAVSVVEVIEGVFSGMPVVNAGGKKQLTGRRERLDTSTT